MLNRPDRNGHDVAPAVAVGLRAPLQALAAGWATVAVVLAVVYRDGTTGGAFDGWVQPGFAALSGRLGDTAYVIDFVGDPRVTSVIVVVVAATCLVVGRRRLAVVAVLGPLLTGVLTTVAKPVVGRTIHGGFLAYPSGHTAAATAMGLVVALLIVDVVRPHRGVATLVVVGGPLVAGVVMAWSQVALDAHYATDTIGGIATATAVVAIVALLVDPVAARWSTTTRGAAG